MSVKNFYIEMPVVPFFTTKVEMGVLINLIQQQESSLEVKRMAYIIIRNETANGRRIINGTNAAGVQSDSGRWPAKWDTTITGTTVQKGNREQYLRGFVVFNSLTTSIQFLCERLQARGIFIGGFSHKIFKQNIVSASDLARAYYAEWVFGNLKDKPNQKQIADFVSMYNQAVKIFVK